MKKINLGLFGLGSVGTGLFDLLNQNQQTILDRCQHRFQIKKIVVRDCHKKRNIKSQADLISDDPKQILEDPKIDAMVELVGDKVLTKKIFRCCDQRKIPLITANKAFLAEENHFLRDRFRASFLGFDASVTGAIPILRTLSLGLGGNEINSLVGVVNGTANFILTHMEEKGSTFLEALKKAQEMGYAEADPTFDIKGQDTAHKLIILMGMAFHRCFAYKQLHIEGIDQIGIEDIRSACTLGYRIKLLAVTKKGDGWSQKKPIFEGRVHPTLVPKDSRLASVDDCYNGVLINGNYSGPSFSYGPGAGSYPTASSVVSDLIALADQRLTFGEDIPLKNTHYFFNHREAEILPIENISARYFIRIRVDDRNQELAQITNILAENKVDINKIIRNRVVYSQSKKHSSAVDFVVITRLALEENLLKAIRVINQRKFVLQKVKMIRLLPEHL